MKTFEEAAEQVYGEQNVCPHCGLCQFSDPHTPVDRRIKAISKKSGNQFTWDVVCEDRGNIVVRRPYPQFPGDELALIGKSWWTEVAQNSQEG